MTDDDRPNWILIIFLAGLLAALCGGLFTSKVITGGWTCAFRDCTGEL